MNEEVFTKELEKLNIIIDEEKSNLLKKYYNFLVEYNKKTNLTSIIEYEEVLLKHFYDSLTPTKTINFLDIESVIDIGTGAGFPGVVLKIFYPHLNLTLLDSNNKKIDFLKELTSILDLKEITFIHSRAEELNQREKYDLVIARAVKNLDILLEICLPLVKINGHFIAMKGDSSKEIQENEKVIDLLGCELEKELTFELPIEKSKRSIIKIIKKSKTDNKYPRPYSQIIKKPLKNSIK